MKYLKILGLAAVAAMAMMAMGAGSASATTTLCTTTVAPCPAGDRINASEDFHIKGTFTEGRLWPTSGNTSEPTITCTHGTLTATMESNTTAQLNTFDFEGCHNGHTMTPITLGKLHFHNISGTHNATVTLSKSVFKLTIGITCYFGVEGESPVDIGQLETSTLHVTAVVNRIDNATHNGSFLCPATANWETTGHLVGGTNTPSIIYAVTD